MCATCTSNQQTLYIYVQSALVKISMLQIKLSLCNCHDKMCWMENSVLCIKTELSGVRTFECYVSSWKIRWNYQKISHCVSYPSEAFSANITCINGVCKITIMVVYWRCELWEHTFSHLGCFRWRWTASEIGCFQYKLLFIFRSSNRLQRDGNKSECTCKQAHTATFDPHTTRM